MNFMSITIFIFAIIYLLKGATAQNDSDCGISFGCFSYPTGCKSTDCTFLYKWQNNNNSIYFQLAGKLGTFTNKWLAIGLSKDTKMGDDSVVLCRTSGSVEHYYNPSYYTTVISTSNRNMGISNTTTSQNNQFFLCSFNRQKQVSPSNTQYFDLSQNYFVMAASGALDASNNPLQHSYRTAGSEAVNFSFVGTTSNTTESFTFDYGLGKAHGCLMVIAWVALATTGILFARYFKYLFGDKKFCGTQFWFTIHRPIMTSVPIVSVIAFILILAQENWSWIDPSEPVNFTHSIFGILTIFLSIVQPFIALARCDKEHKKRFIFNYVHRGIGLATLVFAIVAMFTASALGRTFVGNSGWGILIGWTVWIIALTITLEILDIFVIKSIIKAALSLFSINRAVALPLLSKIKSILLMIHIAVTCLFTLALIITIVIGGSFE